MAKVKVTISDAYELYRKKQIIELLLITFKTKEKKKKKNGLINDRAQSVMYCASTLPIGTIFTIEENKSRLNP